MHCHKLASAVKQINLQVAKAFYYVQNTGLNNYALYLDCYGGNGSSSERYRHDMSLLFRNLNHKMRMEILNMKVC